MRSTAVIASVILICSTSTGRTEAQQGGEPLPGSAGPRVEFLNKNAGGVALLDVAVNARVSQPSETGAPILLTGTTAVCIAIRVRGRRPPAGKEFTIAIVNRDGLVEREGASMSLWRGGEQPGELTLNMCPPSDQVYPDGPYKCTVTIDGVAAAVLHWSVGGPVEAQAPAPPNDKNRPAEFRPERLTAGSSTFLMIIEGSETGRVTTTTSIEDGVVTVSSDVQVSMPTGKLTQQSEIKFTADGPEMISSVSTTDFGGIRPVTSVTYDGNRVVGQRQATGPGGVTTTPIDAMIESGTIDAGAASVIITTLTLEEGVTYTFDAFNPATGMTSNFVLRVTGREEVTVPAGTIDAWMVELEVFGKVIEYRVSVGDTPTILKIAPVGSPLEMQLVDQS